MRPILLAASALALAGCESTTQIGSYHNAIWPTAPGTPGQAKNIWITIDGTGNSFQSRTNAGRLFEMIDAYTLRPDGTRVVTYYGQGVGADGSILGGLVGHGMRKDIAEAYLFLAQSWQEGDRIYLSGFSRGAFGVRALGGLVALAGIPDLSAMDHASARKLIYDLFDAYRQKRPKDRSVIAHNRRLYDDLNAVYARYPSARPRGRYFEVPIETLAIWDTVPAMGRPDGTENPADEERSYFVTSCNVRQIYHALALDDNRNYSFTPMFAQGPAAKAACPQPDNMATEAVPTADRDLPLPQDINRDPVTGEERIEEVWFAGAHADVGGAYGDFDRLDGYLPGVSLNWMIGHLQQDGLLPPGLRVYEDAFGPIHDAERYRAYYRVLSRRYRQPMRMHREWVGDDQPIKVHASAIARYRYLYWLDNRFARCPERQGTSYPADSHYAAKAGGPKPPLLCADSIEGVGLLAEMIGEGRGNTGTRDEPCVRATQDGYELLDDQACLVSIGTLSWPR